ncbi:proton-conducting transporter transmembrane domain-containing protein [Azotobacter armeniacus]
MTGAWLWLLVPLAPLLAGVGLLVWRERAIPWLSLACIPALAMVFFQPPPVDLPWLWAGERWGHDDELSRAWLGFSALLWSCAGVFGASSLAGDSRRLRFWSFWLLALAGNLLLIIASDALSFYLGFSVMSLAAYGLVVHLGGPGPRRAGRLYLQLAVLGEIFLLAGFLLRSHAAGGDFSFVAWRALPLDGLTLVLLLLGLGLKAGFWPLHLWLPLAHPAAPAPASAVLSGAMLKAGILGLWRCLPEDDPLLVGWSGTLLATGMFGALYAVLHGLCSSKAKEALAWSSVSQMGWFLMVHALAWRHPAQASALATLLVLYGVHHGLAKGALFLAAGLCHGGRLRWPCWLLLSVPALALMGLPLSSGGAVKTALKDAWNESAYSVWQPWLSLGSAGTALLLLRALWLLRRDAEHAPPRSPPLAQWLPWALLSSLPLLLPWLWPGLRLPLLVSLSLDGVWKLLWPLLLAATLATLAVCCGWSVPEPLSRRSNLALGLSLRVTRLLRRPPLPAPELHPDKVNWRRRERHWNRLWRGAALPFSAWLLAVLLWLGWLW